MNPLYQTLRDQFINGPAQRMPIDAKARGKLRLCGQPVALVQRPLDLSAQGLGDLRPDGDTGISDKLWHRHIPTRVVQTSRRVR
jgi:hypothetical protein